MFFFVFCPPLTSPFFTCPGPFFFPTRTLTHTHTRSSNLLCSAPSISVFQVVQVLRAIDRDEGGNDSTVYFSIPPESNAALNFSVRDSGGGHSIFSLSLFLSFSLYVSYFPSSVVCAQAVYFPLPLPLPLKIPPSPLFSSFCAPSSRHAFSHCFANSNTKSLTHKNTHTYISR